MDWDVRYNGSSIKEKVNSCTITKSIDSFCREVNIDLIDTSLYGSINWTRIPEDALIEVSVYVDAWHTLGRFFVERPTYSADPDSKGMRGLWGRSKTAILSEPFAKTITKTWTAQTDIFSICEEVISGSGIVFSRAKCGIPNFTVFPLTYSADKLYPIDVITELAEICGCVVMTSNEDDIFITPFNYNPYTADFTITDSTIKEYSEEMVFPDFKNRVLIASDNSADGYDLQILADTECLNVGETTRVQLYAKVTDDNGVGINDVPIQWSTTSGLVLLDYASSMTGTMTVVEEVQANGFYSFDLKFVPETITSVVMKNPGYGESNNYADSGYSIDGNSVVLGEMLKYCDQTLIVTYQTSGIATNTMRAGNYYGDDTVIAAVGGARATVDVYIGNPCKCTGSDGDGEDVGYGITLLALPKNICSNGGALNAVCPCPVEPGCISQLLVAVDEYGPVKDGRVVTWSEITTGTKCLRFEYERGYLGIVNVEDIEATILEIQPNYIVCSTPFYFMGLTGEWQPTQVAPRQSLGTAWSVDGKSFRLTKKDGMVVGTKVLVAGPIWGAQIMDATGVYVGKATVKASVQGRKEEPMEATVDVYVGVTDPSDPNKPYDPNDPNKPKPSPDPTDPNNKFNGKTSVFCQDSATGARTPCKPGEKCCPDANNSVACRAPDQCKEGSLPCTTSDCSGSPNEACMEGRFAKGLENKCTCEDLCNQEFNRLWTTQSYDNNSYKPVSTIVSNTYGYPAGTPDYWAKFEEQKKAAIDKCRAECDQCQDAPEVILNGPDTVTKPGSFMFTASIGTAPFAYSVSGTGATVDAATGLVTLSAVACGSITVTVTDACGKTASMTARITNSGSWSAPVYVECGGQGGKWVDGKFCEFQSGNECNLSVPDEINGTTWTSYGYVSACCDVGRTEIGTPCTGEILDCIKTNFCGPDTTGRTHTFTVGKYVKTWQC